MPFDPITGKRKRTDITGKKVPLTEYRREVLTDNRRKGRDAEYQSRIDHLIKGEFTEKKHKGRDFVVSTYNINTGNVEFLYEEEVKSGKAKVSDAQQKRMKKLGPEKYRVKRYRDDQLLY